jgi:hypothetical protein
MKSLSIVTAASLAALLVPAMPASAQEFSGGSQFRNDPGISRIHVGMPSQFEGAFGTPFGCDGRDRHHRDGRFHRAAVDCAAFAAGFGYFDEDINRSWDSDSFNDWWNDRPDRAYPRWIYHNQNCTPDRMWWSGSGWHC